jgi:hypothetical protein
VRIDGRGNIGVSWYDTRFETWIPQSKHKYDVFFAHSSDGGTSWSEQRLTGDGIAPFFDSVNNASDYSGMAADPRAGTAHFYMLAMGTPVGETEASQDIFSYEVKLRGRGDYDGDFDIDGYDAAFNSCLGNTIDPCTSCGVLDLTGPGGVPMAPC